MSIKPETDARQSLPPQAVPVLLVSVFLIAICGILYELLISSMSVYFLGSSILHFSLTIGLFLSFMGFGAFLSKYCSDEKLLTLFIHTELYLGAIGGASGIILYSAYAFDVPYYLVAFLLTGCIGSLVGIEIPLLTRLIRLRFPLKDTLAQVLSFDYIGALVASVIFPLVLLPHLGLMRTAFLVGLMNIAIGAFNIWVFRALLPQINRLWLSVAVVGVVYTFAFWQSPLVNRFFEQMLYQDEVYYAERSAYQNLVITRWKDDLRLFIDGNLQFSSVDEYRYHEPLVHLPMLAVPRPERVLLLGAGDGLAAREVLRYPEVTEIVVVDLDPAMTKLGQTHPFLRQLSADALNNKKVKIVNEDAYKYIENGTSRFDVIIIDLPDPNDVSIGKLYTEEFYRLVQKRLAAQGAVVSQSTSPFFAPRSFWCIHQTLEAVFPTVYAYNANVHSFGQWGFNLALNYPQDAEAAPYAQTLSKRLAARKYPLRFLSPELLPTLFVFDLDTQEVKTQTNRLDNQMLVQYYEREWERYN
ncbi:polyamine aminopropyltransferase [Eisenibacter elegans]|jgi:spermidine synthase|uniref:polyamine aminopropyltransferase n=1 Tax=Eisenibacter elegans TaxID=997 RepID=UPI000429E412|nr:polyamine aminopropyltransferase [Eisenibacter elegans]